MLAALDALVRLCEPAAMQREGWLVKRVQGGSFRLQTEDESIQFKWTKQSKAELKKGLGVAFKAVEEWVESEKESAKQRADKARKVPRPRADKTRRHLKATEDRNRERKLPTQREATLSGRFHFLPYPPLTARLRLRVPKVGGHKPPQPPPQLGPEEDVLRGLQSLRASSADCCVSIRRLRCSVTTRQCSRSSRRKERHRALGTTSEQRCSSSAPC